MMHKQRAIWIWSGVAVGLALLAGALYLARRTDAMAWMERELGALVGIQPREPKTEAEGGGADDRAKRVTVVHPTAGGGRRTTTQPASVHSFGIVDLFTKVSGYLTDQQVDIGDTVTKGEVLARIDAPEISAHADRAAAVVEKAQVNVERAQAALAARQADLKSAQARAEQAEAELASYQADVKFRELQYERIKQLAELKSIEWELVDEQDKQLEVARSKLRAGQKALATAQARVFAAEAAIKEAQAALADAKAQVKVEQADLAAARQQVDYMAVKAPFDGVVTKRYFYDGDFVRAATGGGNIPKVTIPVLRVARTDKMRVVVRVPDRDVPYVERGDAATITIDSLRGASFSGRVNRVARAEEYDTRYMRVEIDLANPQGKLADGMYGSATIVLVDERPGVRVPSSCLVSAGNDDSRGVFVVQDGRAKRRSVTVGDDDGRLTQVLEGLSPADAVITGRLGSISDGDPVRVVQAAQDQSQQEANRATAGDRPSAGERPKSVASRDGSGGQGK